MRSMLVCSALGVLGVAGALACEGPVGGAVASAADAGGDAPAVAPDTGTDAAPPAVLGIDVSPVQLTPAFSQSTHDYYVRCAAGDNVLTLTVTDGLGSESSTVDVSEDQAIVVQDQYWIRCLPHDFPVVTVTPHPEAGSPTPGYYLVNTPTYAIVLDTSGTPVWYERGTSVANVDALTPNTISFVPNATGPYGWSGATFTEFYQLASRTTATEEAVGTPTDGHELRLMPNGDYLLFTYPITNHVDLTGLQTFGSDENMADCEIQEVDPTGQLVWSWLASDHIDPRKESLEPALNTINGASVVDPFHCNSIDLDTNGDFLVSLRHANAVYYVDRDTGGVEWKLGGTSYNKDGAPCITVTGDTEGTFNMQHDARLRPGGGVSLFDDHGATAGVGLGRGVEYAIDHTNGTATVAWQFLGSAQSGYEGSFRRYADGHSVIGWGFVATDQRVVTEVDATGNDVLDIAFSIGPSYRAVKVPLSQLDIGLLRATSAQ